MHPLGLQNIFKSQLKIIVFKSVILCAKHFALTFVCYYLYEVGNPQHKKMRVTGTLKYLFSKENPGKLKKKNLMDSEMFMTIKTTGLQIFSRLVGRSDPWNKKWWVVF